MPNLEKMPKMPSSHWMSYRQPKSLKGIQVAMIFKRDKQQILRLILRNGWHCWLIKSSKQVIDYHNL